MKPQPKTAKEICDRFNRGTRRNAIIAAIVYLILFPAAAYVGTRYCPPEQHKYVIGMATLACLLAIAQHVYFIVHHKQTPSND